jgi:hypothetical protein
MPVGLSFVPKYTLTVSFFADIQSTPTGLTAITTQGMAVPLTQEAAHFFVGPAGTPGISGGAMQLVPTVTPIGGHRVLALDNVGKAVYADSTSLPLTQRVVGVSTSSTAAGIDAPIQTYGAMEEPSWNWDTELPVFLGTNGTLTQTPPTTPSKASIVVGFPTSPTTLFINIQQPILII